MKVAKPFGQDGGIVIVDTEESAGPCEDISSLSPVAGCREVTPRGTEVEIDLIKGAASELEARYKKAVVESRLKSAAQNAVQIILAHRTQYERVQTQTGVPWWLVGALHMRESNNDFSTWLANGDPLSAPTTHVPAGLRCPGNPPWDWFDAAIVSLSHQNDNQKITIGTMGEALDYAERYNGLGYRTGAGRGTVPPETSPYLWSGTDQYRRGKYVEDGRFDPNAVDQQVGCACVFKEFEAQGLKLFGGDAPNDQQVTWFEFYRSEQSNIIVGYAGATPIKRIETTSVKELTEFFQGNTGANSWRVAPQGKEIPNVDPNPAPPAKIEPFIKITRKQNAPDARGLVPLKVDFFGPDGKIYGTLECISGLPGAQFFRRGPDSKAGSGEPLPQGTWAVGDIAFANGRDNYTGTWGSGLGPVWVPLTPQFETSRAAIGMHRDDNAPGSLGCCAFPDTAALRQLVAYLRQCDPKILRVDWGL